MSDDEKVSFSTSDPFAASSEAEPEPTPEPEPVAEVVETPEADPMLKPEQENEPTPAAPAKPEAKPAPVAPVEPPLSELPEIAPPSDEQIAAEMARRQIEEQNRREDERARIEANRRYQAEEGLLRWAERIKTDAEFANAELDRLTLPQYLDLLAEAKTVPMRREAAAREYQQRQLLEKQEQMRASIKAEHAAKTATERAYSYGQSLGLKEEQIAAVFERHGNWAHQPDLKKAWLDCRNALYFEATTQGIPDAAKTVVAAEEIARRTVAQGGTPGGSPGLRKKSDDEIWAENMARAINGESTNIFT